MPKYAARYQAFTLVEILIVVAVLGILAVMVVPQFASASSDAKISSAAITVKLIQERVGYFQATTGQIPQAIEPSWFANNSLPQSPFGENLALPVYYDVDNDLTKVHPTIKDNSNPTIGAFWYNRLNGKVRVRVEPQANDAQTLALYNAVHGSALTTINQIRD